MTAKNLYDLPKVINKSELAFEYYRITGNPYATKIAAKKQFFQDKNIDQRKLFEALYNLLPDWFTNRTQVAPQPTYADKAADK